MLIFNYTINEYFSAKVSSSDLSKYFNFKGQKVKLTIPPLLSENIIEAIRRKSEHNKKFNRKPKHQYLLSGFIRCKKCGYILSCQTNHLGQSYAKSYYRHPKDRKKECNNFQFYIH